MQSRTFGFLIACALFALLLPMSSAQSLTVYAKAPLDDTNQPLLEEFFIAENGGIIPASSSDDPVRWNWWCWSEETGSDWPDDDGIYRRDYLGVNPNNDTEKKLVEHRVNPDKVDVEMDGEVNVVMGEDKIRFVQFHLEITPMVNLSNQALLYIVLTEDQARDHHGREAVQLVREMRPEVGFSLQAFNTSNVVYEWPADHLEAAGVDLEDEPAGWSYTIAIFGNVDNATMQHELLLLRHGNLPTPYLHTTPSQQWMPLAFSAVAIIIAATVVSNARKRELMIPHITTGWKTDDLTTIIVRIRAGATGFSITDWKVLEPWALRGRPPKTSLLPNEEKEFTLSLRRAEEEDCHVEVGLDLDELGAWRQHIWLPHPSPSTRPSVSEPDA